MKGKKIYVFILAAITVFILMGSSISTSMPALTVKYASSAPGPPNYNAVPDDYFQKRVTELSGGQITFKNYWGGTVLSTGTLLEGIQARVVDIVSGFTAYFPGKLPLSLFEGKFLFRPSDPLLETKVIRQMYEAIPAMMEELESYNIELLFFRPGLSFNLQFNAPIKTFDEMKGKKVGVVAPYVGMFENTGAIPVVIPGPDRYLSLQRGLIDGQLMPIGPVVSEKHYEVAPYFMWIDSGCSVAATSTWANREFWDSLTPEQREVFIQAAKETETWGAEWMAKQNVEYLNSLKKVDVTFSTMSAADRSKWAQALPDLASVWAKEMEAKGMPGWQIVDTYIKLTKEAGHKWPREWGKER